MENNIQDEKEELYSKSEINEKPIVTYKDMLVLFFFFFFILFIMSKF